MTARISRFVLIPLSLLLLTCSADGRGFGGFRGGGGYRAGGFSGYRSAGFSTSRSGGWGGYHTNDFSRYRSSDAGWSACGSTFDRSWDALCGGSISSTGYRGAATTPWGGAAGRAREVTATGPEGRSFSSTRSSAAAWNHFPTDGGLSRYSSVAVASTHRTAYWSHNYMTMCATSIRTGFGYYGRFPRRLVWGPPGMLATGRLGCRIDGLVARGLGRHVFGPGAESPQPRPTTITATPSSTRATTSTSTARTPAPPSSTRRRRSTWPPRASRLTRPRRTRGNRSASTPWSRATRRHRTTFSSSR